MTPPPQLGYSAHFAARTAAFTPSINWLGEGKGRGGREGWRSQINGLGSQAKGRGS